MSGFAFRPALSLLVLCALFCVDAQGAPEAPRAWSTKAKAMVYVRASRSAQKLGYLNAGAAVQLRGAKPLPGAGCGAGFLPVVPRGHVCAGDVSFSPNDAAVRTERALGRKPGPYPFDYAFSLGAPILGALPEPGARARLPSLTRPKKIRIRRWQQRHARLAVMDPAPLGLRAGAPPESAIRKSAHRFAPNGVLLAYSRRFVHAGEEWLQRKDGAIMPASRVLPFRRSHFQGVQLGGELNLPVAWVRGDSAALVQRNVNRSQRGAPESSGRSPAFPRRSLIPLASGKTENGYLRTRLKTSEHAALWLKASPAISIVTLPRRPSHVSREEKWIWISVSRGVLVALEGDRAVFTTLISPGRGGNSHPGRDNAQNVERATTPLGGFRVQHKYWSHTMSPDKPKPQSDWTQWTEEVQFSQFFDVPFALHTSYWHEDFGAPMSNGCVNLSPIDAERLFNWTEPQLPAGWAGIYAHRSHGKGTPIVIRR